MKKGRSILLNLVVLFAASSAADAAKGQTFSLGEVHCLLSAGATSADFDEYAKSKASVEKSYSDSKATDQDELDSLDNLGGASIDLSFCLPRGGSGSGW